MRISNSCEV